MLEKMTLASLEKTKLKNMFDNALGEVLHSLAHEADIPGDRGISMSIKFKPKDGYIIMQMSCTHKVPGREVSTIATLENDKELKIDTTSGDARQTGIEFPENVTSIEAARQKEGAAQ